MGAANGSPRLRYGLRRLAVKSLAAAWLVTGPGAFGIDPPTGLVSRVGDESIVLHWDHASETNFFGYRVYRGLSADGPYTLQSSNLKYPGFADVNVTNGVTYYYQVSTLTRGGEGPKSATLAAAPRPFANDDDFLDYIQATHFDYFWYGANPTNGLVPDRLPSASPCSIAAVGFGLSAICIGIDHGWITRAQGLERVRVTLRTFLHGPQGTNTSGTIGYKGWFYHFLDMGTARRYTQFNTELSSIDTALLLGGVLDARQYFDRDDLAEREVREMADTLYARVDWSWMARGGEVLSMGWLPPSAFLTSNWIGYNEAMILYIMAIGAETNALPASSWNRWTNGYSWATLYGQSFLRFPPLFGHQYSHCWVDFRHLADSYMLERQSTYFENSRRATLAQRAYCIANPSGRVGYSSNVWGITACDGPNGYSARGAPPAENDDGTIAPTAAGGSIAFTPEYSIPTLRHFYTQYRKSIWTAFGFRDAFNLGAQWWGPDTLGIDQGPIVIMIENYRTQRVWKRFMRNPEIQRGLDRIGFTPLSSVVPQVQPRREQGQIDLTWPGAAGNAFQVEFSPDLYRWFRSPAPQTSIGDFFVWSDPGLPATSEPPFTVPFRFYRVSKFGPP